MSHPVTYVKVHGNFGGFIIDGIDPDDRPDEVGLRGSVRFSLLLNDRDAVLMPSHPNGSTLRVVDGFEVEIDADGDLSHRGRKYVLLPALDEWTNPQRGAYRVDFINISIGGQRINLRPIEIPATAGTVDLARAFPVPGTPAPGITRGDKGDSVSAVRRDGAVLVFTLDTSPPRDLAPVPLPEVSALAGWRDHAQSAATAAASSATAAAGSAEQARGWAQAAENATLPDNSVSATKLAAAVRASLARADTASQSGHSHTVAEIAELQGALDAKENAGAATALRGNAPAALDTLGKLASAVGNNPSYASDITAALAGKYSKPPAGIPAADLADGAVTTAKLAPGAVASPTIADGSITDANISASAGIAVSKLGTGRVTGSSSAGAKTVTLWFGTEAEFTAITNKDPNTLYHRT
ncbi:phage upper tail fiber protein [Nocardia brasiliensis]|uniref:phage upper tail fiber protein n=1 Tax=Nocardia brasiliensis TaxID=37326 RepID=UPI002454E411|nr:hypothetical protein [Nocardia brasiliensis]